MSTIHKVTQGECLARIAKQYGFSDWQRLLTAPENSAFAGRCSNPNILYPGEELVILEREPGEEPGATDQRHVFQCQRPRRVLRIATEDIQGKRLANKEWILKVNGLRFKGRTDANGLLEHEVPMEAEDAHLKVGPYSWDIQIGYLNPIDETAPDQGVSGAQGRLRNMGYDAGPIDGMLGRKTHAALKAFQADQKLGVTGNLDRPTRTKLREIYGC
jgi:hypothetical protein